MEKKDAYFFQNKTMIVPLRELNVSNIFEGEKIFNND